MKSAYAQKSESSQSVTTHDASCVDDRRTLPVAQRVLQRECGVVQRHPADGSFKFYPDISGDSYKDRVPYLPGKICFTPYTGGEVKSAGFNGCFMMAFKFKNTKRDDGTDYKLLIAHPNNLNENFNQIYIAHVANNARVALVDADVNQLIEILSIIRPYRNCLIDAPFGFAKSEDNKATSGRAATSYLTGGLTQTPNGWTSNVYLQEKFYDKIGDMNDFRWRNQLLTDRCLNEREMDEETKVNKAFVYASVADENGEDGSMEKKAYDFLDRIASAGSRPLAPIGVARNLYYNASAEDAFSRYGNRSPDVVARENLDKILNKYRG